MKKTWFAYLFIGMLFNCAGPAYSQQTSTEVAKETFEKFVNKEKGYEIEYPKSWTKREAPNFDLVLVAEQKGSERITATMNLISEYVGKTITLDNFYNENVPTISKELKNAKIQDQGEETINNVRTKWIRYSHEMSDIQFEVLQYFVVDKGFAYLLTFSALADEFKKYENEFKQIAKTFHLTAPEIPKDPT